MTDIIIYIIKNRDILMHTFSVGWMWTPQSCDGSNISIAYDLTLPKPMMYFFRKFDYQTIKLSKTKN